MVSHGRLISVLLSRLQMRGEAELQQLPQSLRSDLRMSTLQCCSRFVKKRRMQMALPAEPHREAQLLSSSSADEPFFSPPSMLSLFLLLLKLPIDRSDSRSGFCAPAGLLASFFFLTSTPQKPPEVLGLMRAVTLHETRGLIPVLKTTDLLFIFTILSSLMLLKFDGPNEHELQRNCCVHSLEPWQQAMLTLKDDKPVLDEIIRELERRLPSAEVGLLDDHLNYLLRPQPRLRGSGTKSVYKSLSVMQSTSSNLGISRDEFCLFIPKITSYFAIQRRDASIIGHRDTATYTDFTLDAPTASPEAAPNTEAPPSSISPLFVAKVASTLAQTTLFQHIDDVLAARPLESIEWRLLIACACTQIEPWAAVAHPVLKRAVENVGKPQGDPFARLSEIEQQRLLHRIIVDLHSARFYGSSSLRIICLTSPFLFLFLQTLPQRAATSLSPQSAATLQKEADSFFSALRCINDTLSLLLLQRREIPDFFDASAMEELLRLNSAALEVRTLLMTNGMALVPRIRGLDTLFAFRKLQLAMSISSGTTVAQGVAVAAVDAIKEWEVNKSLFLGPDMIADSTEERRADAALPHVDRFLNFVDLIPFDTLHNEVKECICLSYSRRLMEMATLLDDLSGVTVSPNALNRIKVTLVRQIQIWVPRIRRFEEEKLESHAFSDIKQSILHFALSAIRFSSRVEMGSKCDQRSGVAKSVPTLCGGASPKSDRVAEVVTVTEMLSIMRWSFLLFSEISFSQSDEVVNIEAAALPMLKRFAELWSLSDPFVLAAMASYSHPLYVLSYFMASFFAMNFTGGTVLHALTNALRATGTEESVKALPLIRRSVVAANFADIYFALEPLFSLSKTSRILARQCLVIVARMSQEKLAYVPPARAQHASAATMEMELIDRQKTAVGIWYVFIAVFTSPLRHPAIDRYLSAMEHFIKRNIAPPLQRHSALPKEVTFDDLKESEARLNANDTSHWRRTHHLCTETLDSYGRCNSTIVHVTFSLRRYLFLILKEKNAHPSTARLKQCLRPIEVFCSMVLEMQHSLAPSAWFMIMSNAILIHILPIPKELFAPSLGQVLQISMDRVLTFAYGMENSGKWNPCFLPLQSTAEEATDRDIVEVVSGSAVLLSYPLLLRLFSFQEHLQSVKSRSYLVELLNRSMAQNLDCEEAIPLDAASGHPANEEVRLRRQQLQLQGVFSAFRRMRW